MKYLFSGFIICCCFKLCAQQKITVPEDDKFICPYRPRIAEFTVANLYEYNAFSNSETYGNRNVEIEREQQIKVRLGVPIIMKDGTLFAAQLKYDRQNFMIDFEDNLPYELYNHIQTTAFTSLGGRFLFQQKLTDNKEISVLAGAEIKSDEITINKNTTKWYASVNYLVKRNERVKLGGGVAFAYTLGIPQVYPFVFYENKVSSKWTLDLALPKAAIMRYMANEKFYVSFKTEVKGWRYATHNTNLSEDGPMSLRKTDLRFGLNLEHEIHDWLWMGADGGVSKNLRHYLAEAGDRYRDATIDLHSTSSPYLNLSLFIVPPKKLYR